MASCCAWSDFESGVNRLWKLPHPVDWVRAKVAWKKHCATPSEFVRHCEREHRERLQLGKDGERG